MSATAMRLDADVEQTDINPPFELKLAVDRQTNLFRLRKEDAVSRIGEAASDLPGTETTKEPAIDLPTLVSIKDAQEQFISSQEWDGYVTAILKSSVRGVMYPVGSVGPQNEELVEIPKEFIGEETSRNVRVGSVFRFATGKLVRRKQIMQGSKVYFRKAARLRSNPEQVSALEDLFAD